MSGFIRNLLTLLQALQALQALLALLASRPLNFPPRVISHFRVMPWDSGTTVLKGARRQDRANVGGCRQ